MDAVQFEQLRAKLQANKQQTGKPFVLPKTGADLNNNKTDLLSNVNDIVQKIGQGAGEIGSGAIKEGILKPLDVLSGFGQNIARKVGLQKEPVSTLKSITGKDITTAKTPLEKLGGGIAQTAEFLSPIGIETKGASLLTKAAVSGAEYGAKTAIQGGTPGDTGINTIIGSITPPAIRGVEKIAPKIGNIAADVLSKMSGQDSEAIKIAFKNPVEVAKSMAQKITPSDVRDKAVNALNSFRKSYTDEFSNGLENIKDLYKTGMKGYPNMKLEKPINDETKGIPAIFRQFAVGVEKNGTKLNFNKLNSSIVKAGEQKNLQAVYDTIRNQKDFSVQGTQRVASRINALSEFVEGAKTQSSAIISKIHDVYSNAIEKAYPQLGELRKEYSKNSQIYQGIDSVLKSVVNDVSDPGKATTAVKKLTSLFHEDNDAYLKAIKRLEQVSGVDLMKDLAASQFRDISPKSFGSKLGEVALLAGGIFHNPLDLLVLPLFSPKVQGKLATKSGLLAPKITEKGVSTAVKGIKKGIDLLTQ